MKAGLYLVKPLAGNEGMPGAPLLHLELAVYAPTGQITGRGEITQAIAGPESDLRIHGITGQIHSLGLGEARRVVALRGEYEVPFPPPAIGESRKPFSAVLVIGEDDWNGKGSFTYGDHKVDDVPVKPEED